MRVNVEGDLKIGKHYTEKASTFLYLGHLISIKGQIVKISRQCTQGRDLFFKFKDIY